MNITHRFHSAALIAVLTLFPVSLAGQEGLSGRESELIGTLNSAFQKIAARVTPSVVSISSTRQSNGPENGEERSRHSTGSGVIVSADGLILTNSHVIDRAESIEVVLLDGRTYGASVMGVDYTTDLAVLRTEELEQGSSLPLISFGDSDSCRTGAWVIAIGNPLDLGLSVTAGIISAKSRKLDILSDNPENIRGNIDHSIESFIQTDAVINPGNSGGALINLEGELVGINTAIASQSGTYAGYGFAIPVNLARRVMEDLVEYGRVLRPVLGVVIQALGPVEARALGLQSPQGVLVEDFSPRTGSPAQIGGIERGDVIVSVDGARVSYPNQLQETIAKYRPGDRAEVTVFRDSARVTLSVVLGSREIPGSGPRPAVAETLPRTSTLGLVLRDMEPIDRDELGVPGGRGVFVESVTTRSPAARSGLLAGDVILTVNRRQVASVAEIRGLLDDAATGSAVLFMVLRQGVTRFVGVEVP